MTNICLALLYAAFAYAHVLQFTLAPRPSFLLVVAFETLVVAMVLMRSDAKCRSSCSRPRAGEDVMIGQAVQVLRVLLQCAAICRSGAASASCRRIAVFGRAACMPGSATRFTPPI